jgi:hypothetical protein
MAERVKSIKISLINEQRSPPGSANHSKERAIRN